MSFAWYQLLDGDQLKAACEASQLCIIAFMPNILDCQSACRNDYIKTLQTMADKYKKRSWR